MKTKSRDYRKLERARKRFDNALRNGVDYGNGLMIFQLHMMSVSRWYFDKYPKPMPKFTYVYNKDQTFKPK